MHLGDWLEDQKLTVPGASQAARGSSRAAAAGHKGQSADHIDVPAEQLPPRTLPLLNPGRRGGEASTVQSTGQVIKF